MSSWICDMSSHGQMVLGKLLLIFIKSVIHSRNITIENV